MKELKWHATINEIKGHISNHKWKHKEFPTQFRIEHNGKFVYYDIEKIDDEFILTNVDSNFLAIGFNFRIKIDLNYEVFGDIIPYEVFMGRIDYINNL